MKKIIIAALALTAFAACNKSEVVDAPQGAAIAFENAFVDNATKAATDLTASNLNDFSVYGSVEANDTEGMIFTNQKVAKNGNAYTYSPVQYWIANAQYYFAAFAPYTSAAWTYAPAVKDGAENATAAYTGTLTFDNESAKASQDLLYAYVKPDVTPTSIISQPDPVKFTFTHKLSKVAFKFTNAFAEGSNITLKVYDVKINNAAGEGSLPITDGTDGTWTADAENNSFEITYGPTVDNATDIAIDKDFVTDHYYLIPVTREYKITFSVDLYQAGVKVATYPHEVSTNIALSKGSSYSLNATLNEKTVNPDSQLFPIEFAVEEIDDWVSGDVSIVTPSVTE